MKQSGSQEINDKDKTISRDMNQTIHTRRTINGLQLRPRLVIVASVKCTLLMWAKSALWTASRMTSTQLLGGVCRVAAVAYRYAITSRPKPTRGDLSDVGSASTAGQQMAATSRGYYSSNLCTWNERKTNCRKLFFSFENVDGLWQWLYWYQDFGRLTLQG